MTALTQKRCAEQIFPSPTRRAFQNTWRPESTVGLAMCAVRNTQQLDSYALIASTRFSTPTMLSTRVRS